MKVIASAVLLLTLLSNTSTVNGSVGKAGKSNAAASYSYSYSYTATGKAGKSEAAKSTDGGEEKAGAGACNPETIQGLWQYTSQTSGVAWNAFIGCTNSGVPDTRCQMTDQPHWKTEDCVTIAFFDPSYISVNENGYCSFGYNDKGLLVFKPTGDCAYSDAVKNGDYAVKGQVTPGGVLELLFTDDGGATFYNEDNVRLALNAAN